MNTKYIAIVATDIKNGIGRDGTIPWYLPGDLQRFKKETLTHVCIMGRKTYQSLPDKARPLRQRYNIILTKDPNWSPIEKEKHDNMEVVFSITQAIKAAETHIEKKKLGSDGKVYVIGGEQIYAAFLPLVTRIIWTRLSTAHEPPCTAFFPTIKFLAQDSTERDPKKNDWVLQYQERLTEDVVIDTIERSHPDLTMDILSTQSSPHRQ